MHRARARANRETDRQTFQAMEGFVHNLNTMHSRAGAQTPFSSINYGTDTTPEGRMAIRNILLAEDAGLGHGETPIFPLHIFKVKELSLIHILPAERKVTVLHEGEGSILAVSCDSQAFTTSFAGMKVSLSPAAGLDAGVYTGTVTIITGDNAAHLIGVSVTITEKIPDPPPEPIVPDLSLIHI